MAIFKGIIRGAGFASLAVASAGTFMGYVEGWAPCHGAPYSLDGAFFGLLVSFVFYVPHAAAVGAIVGGVVGAFARQPEPGDPPNRRWTLRQCMAIIAFIGVLLALARPLVLHRTEDTDAEADYVIEDFVPDTREK